MAGPVRFNEKEISLSRWKWGGKNPRGQRVKGNVVATSREEVENMLRTQRITVTFIRRKGKVGRGLGRITNRDIMLFARQMATMISAGLPVLQAFQVVSESIRKPAMSALVQRLMNDVAGGSSFAEALRQHPQHFDSLFCHLIDAGEQSGTLDGMLERIAIYKEKTESLKSRVKKALWYPAAVILVGIGVSALLLIKVVPQFESMFAGFGAELPAATQFTIYLSELAQAYWWKALLAVVGSIMLLRWSMKLSPAVTYRVHALMPHIPVLGQILLKSVMARFARTLSTTFAAGIPLIEALGTSAGSTGNKVYERAVLRVRDDVSEGQRIQFALRMTERFPAMMVQMVGIGEESGALDAMLDRVATYYEEEVDNMVDSLTSLIEPFIIVILGTMVGGLVVSMYLPIFELGSVL
ncbi:type II secretion system F family protein [Halomonas sp.]|uniref:type II secretion system F family protein n=1 Tax=Halomonas sp. TaxID=1486246 RepID=UPI002614BF4C|nr:type II secretion system F family protein [Halomonas sp.]